VNPEYCGRNYLNQNASAIACSHAVSLTSVSGQTLSGELRPSRELDNDLRHLMRVICYPDEEHRDANKAILSETLLRSG